jgi:hypothetical protein
VPRFLLNTSFVDFEKYVYAALTSGTPERKWLPWSIQYNGDTIYNIDKKKRKF